MNNRSLALELLENRLLLASIGGTKFEPNGVPMIRAQFELIGHVDGCGNGQRIALARSTDENGEFRFAQVDPGTYLVGETDKPDTIAPRARPITVVVGQQDITLPPFLTELVDLSVTTEVDDSRTNVGDEIEYTIRISNHAATPATGVLVSDVLPDGLTFMSADPPGAFNSSCNTWSVSQLPPGLSQALKVTATVDPDQAGRTLTSMPFVRGNQTDPASSNNIASVSVTVSEFTSINRAPVARNDALFTNEDAPLRFSAATLLANDSDVDGDSFSIVEFTQPNNGILVFDTDTGIYNYRPRPDFNGPDRFTYTIQDQRGGTAMASVQIIIRPVNDPPSFAIGPDQTVFAEMEPERTEISQWARLVSAGPTDEARQALTFEVTTDSDLFEQGPEVRPDGTLIFTPKPVQQTQSATVTVRLMDNGGTERGGRDTSMEQTFDITVLDITLIPPEPASIARWDGNSDADGGDGRNWSDPFNWRDDVVPAEGSVVEFLGALPPGNQMVNLGDQRRIVSLVVFGDNYTLTGGPLELRPPSTETTEGNVEVLESATATIKSNILGALVKFGSGVLVVEGDIQTFEIDTSDEIDTEQVISGQTRRTLIRGGTVRLNGRSSHTEIDGGTVILGEQGFAGMTVVKNGTLKGVGRIGDLTVGPAGTVAPGLSIGTLVVDGNARIEGTLEVEIDGESHDTLEVNGSLDLRPGSTLRLSNITNSAFVGMQSPTIITAKDGVFGTFTNEPDPEHRSSGLFLRGVDYFFDSVQVQLFQAAPGDANGDGKFSNDDIVQVLVEGKYRSQNLAEWTDGDWNGDGLFDQLDFLEAHTSRKFSNESVLDFDADEVA